MNQHQANRERFLKLYQEYQQKVAGWIGQIWKTSPDNSYEQSDDYKAALEFYRQYEPQADVDYSGVVAYARELYERYDKTDKTLDEKADSIIRYLGGGSALLTFGTLMSIKAESFWSSVSGFVALFCLLPSLICAFFAVWKAVHVRRPQSVASLPDVKFAVQMADFHKTKDKLDYNLWLIFHPICEALYHRNLQKAKLVESAHKLYIATMGLLILPILAIAICLLAAAVQADKPGHASKLEQLPTKAGQKP